MIGGSESGLYRAGMINYDIVIRVFTDVGKANSSPMMTWTAWQNDPPTPLGHGDDKTGDAERGVRAGIGAIESAIEGKVNALDVRVIVDREFRLWEVGRETPIVDELRRVVTGCDSIDKIIETLHRPATP